MNLPGWIMADPEHAPTPWGVEDTDDAIQAICFVHRAGEVEAARIYAKRIPIFDVRQKRFLSLLLGIRL